MTPAVSSISVLMNVPFVLNSSTMPPDGRLVRVRDEDRLCPVDAEVLDVECGVAGWEVREIRVGESSRHLPLAIENVDVAAVLVGGV